MTIGDVVTLKSGGPKMTVMADLGNGTFKCIWFNENAQTFIGDFPNLILKPVEGMRRNHSRR